jgi:hypothetical protein
MLPASEQQAATATAFLKEFAKQAGALGGTVPVEHGLGKRKAHLLALRYAPEHIRAMIEVKRRLDPDWLLGRGTLFAYEVGRSPESSAKSNRRALIGPSISPTCMSARHGESLKGGRL